MRRTRWTLALLLATVALLGCASGATPMRKTYTTLSDVATAATQAMKAFNDRYQNGLQTEEDRTKVLAGWKLFQDSMHVAESLAKIPGHESNPILVGSDALASLLELIATLKAPPSTKKTAPTTTLAFAGGGLRWASI
jgi:hypothetical protein